MEWIQGYLLICRNLAEIQLLTEYSWSDNVNGLMESSHPQRWLEYPYRHLLDCYYPSWLRVWTFLSDCWIRVMFVQGHFEIHLLTLKNTYFISDALKILIVLGTTGKFSFDMVSNWLRLDRNLLLQTKTSNQTWKFTHNDKGDIMHKKYFPSDTWAWLTQSWSHTRIPCEVPGTKSTYGP